jgi:hypothetical protein
MEKKSEKIKVMLMDSEFYDNKTKQQYQEFQTISSTTISLSKQLDSLRKQVFQLESELIPSLEREIEQQGKNSSQFGIDHQQTEQELKTLRTTPKPTVGRVMFLKG